MTRAGFTALDEARFPVVCAVQGGCIQAFTGDTAIFITPGYRFGAIDGLITNFHLPQSSLLMLVSALLGRERTLELYKEAVRERYRFFSYGDGMLIKLK